VLQMQTQTQILTQIQSLQQITVPKQIQQTTRSFPSKVMPSPFNKQTPFRQDFELIKSEKRKKGAWSKRYMWEFPVKGPKELWKVV